MRSKMTLAALLFAAFTQNAAMATSPLEAAQNLASSGEGDPNGFVLMIVCISLLFVFAFSLILAASLHLFKKKPPRASAPNASEIRERTSV